MVAGDGGDGVSPLPAAAGATRNRLAAIARRLRGHVIRMTYAAGTGHPGGSLSAADVMAALYFHELRLDPAAPGWPDRDRFVMSKGHACPVWYAALAERGFFPVCDLLSLRHITSHLQGHPDMRKTPGIDMTAGPLGNGLSTGAGMALGARIAGRSFRVYVLAGEGDLQEGCTWEAALLAGHHRLGYLTLLVDYNRSQVDGRSDDIVSLDPLAAKWQACNWAVREIDGHDLGQILDALDWARSVGDAPVAILARTLKGQGVSFMHDTPDWHGTAPNREQALAALAELDEPWDPALDCLEPTRNPLRRPLVVQAAAAEEAAEAATTEGRAAEAAATGWGAAEAATAGEGKGFAAKLRPAAGRPSRPVRSAFGEALVALGAEFPNLVVLDADISTSLKTAAFRRRYPDRHINFGVAEQNMLAAAAGLATTGLVPLACTYATFASMRACEQIRSFVCYPRLNVKIACSHGGLEVGWDGPTHQGTEDVAIMRALPGMTVVMPADAVAAVSLLRQAVELDGPVYFRMGRNPVPVIYDAAQPFRLGRAVVAREGSDVTFVAMGYMVALALDAADVLAARGIRAAVLDMHTVKPLDGAALIGAAAETGALVTAEDHSVIGGLGGAVAELLAEHYPVPLVRVGVPDTFCRSGTPADLFALYGLDVPALVAAALRVLDRKLHPATEEGRRGR